MFNLQEVLIIANVIISLAVLLYASWSDYKTRQVSNLVWVIYAPLSLIITMADLLLFESSLLPLFAVSVGVTIGIAFLLFYIGGFGGADSKALMCIALALPFAPLTLFYPLVDYAVSPLSQLLFPITIFGNGVLFAAASGIYMIIRNVLWHDKTKAPLFPGSLAKESVFKKILVLVTGYKMNITKVKEKWHIFPMEDINQQVTENTRRLVVIPKDEGREQILERLSSAIDTTRIDRHIWATPGLPMLIFITLGLLSALLFGDLVWLVVRLLLGAS